MFSLWNSCQRQRRGCQNWCTKLSWQSPNGTAPAHTPATSVDCLPPLLQPNHLLNQSFKRPYDVFKSYAYIMGYPLCYAQSHLILKDNFIWDFGGWVSQYAMVSKCAENNSTFTTSTIDFTWIRRKKITIDNPVSELTCLPIYPKEFSLLLITSTCNSR